MTAEDGVLATAVPYDSVSGVLSMLYFRACPKCQTGTVEHNNDPWGNYIKCVNCGFTRDLPDGANAAAELKRLRAELASAGAPAVAAEHGSARKRKAA